MFVIGIYWLILRSSAQHSLVSPWKKDARNIMSRCMLSDQMVPIKFLMAMMHSMSVNTSCETKQHTQVCVILHGFSVFVQLKNFLDRLFLLRCDNSSTYFCRWLYAGHVEFFAIFLYSLHVLFRRYANKPLFFWLVTTVKNLKQRSFL